MTDALIIGAGPAGLMAADVLSEAGHCVVVADAMPSVGRKFLMAGKSGLNLTKDEDPEAFLTRYGQVPASFANAIAAFGPVEVMSWAEDLGQPIFTGSTGRVFPKAMKASPLLRAWLARLTARGVIFRARWHWDGFDDNGLVFSTPDGVVRVAPKVTILACGGGSWKRLGSSGAWAAHLDDVAPFQPANMGFARDWSTHMTPAFGLPMKAVALMAGDVTTRGEWVITARGIEGGGVYEVAAAVRDGASLSVDLLPDWTIEKVAKRLAGKRKKMSRSQMLRKGLGLSPQKALLFNELTQGAVIEGTDALADKVKALPLSVDGPLPIDGAISTAGGLRFSALTDHFMVRARPGVFAAGEMLDWEAPTGGYLITGCLATGRAAALGALRHLG